MRSGASAVKLEPYPTVSPATSCCVPMMRLCSVMVGDSPQWVALRSGKSGALPYMRMPARTQSERRLAACSSPDVWRSTAALLDSVRSPGRSAAATLKAAS